MWRLLRTTTFRFTLLFVLLFTWAVGVLGAYVYRVSFGAAAQQTDDLIDQEVTLLTEIFTTTGPGGLVRAIRQRVAWRDQTIYMMINAPAGAQMAGNLTALPPEALGAQGQAFNFVYEQPALDAAGRETGVETRRARGKLFSIRVTPEAEQFFLVLVARDVESRENLRERINGVFRTITVATVVLGVIIGILFSRSLLARVEAVNKTVRAIRDGDLSQRISVTDTRDDIDYLSENLNDMLDQIERLMTGMREMSDNIAHDLRSPLTRMRNRIADAIDKTDANAQEEALVATLADTERMLATFNGILSIGRIQSGEGARDMEPVDLVAVADEMVELYEPAAQEAGFVLTVIAEPSPQIMGKRALICQAFANLLDNALKYADGGERIEVRVNKTPGGSVVLQIADDGPGIDVGDRERVRERFVRLDESRTTQGNGLGLSLVAAIAHAHKAVFDIADGLERADGGRGAAMVLTFPPAKV